MDYLSADVRVLVPGVWQEFTSTTINVKDASKCIRYFCRSEVDIFSREVRLVCVQSRPTVCVVVRGFASCSCFGSEVPLVCGLGLQPSSYRRLLFGVLVDASVGTRGRALV